MAYGDVDFLEKNNINCEFEDSSGYNQRAILVIDGLSANTLSYSRDGSVVTTYEDDYVARGYGYESNLVLSVPDGLNYFLFTLSDVPDGYGIFVLPLKVNATAGPIVINYRVGHDYSGGTALRTINRNALSINTPSAQILQGPTGTTLGIVNTANLIGTTGIPTVTTGGNGGSSAPFIASNLVDFLLEVDNQNGSAVQVEYELRWYEIPLGV